MGALASIDQNIKEAERYLRMLGTGAPPGALFDVRYAAQRDEDLARFFIPVHDHDAATRIARLGRRTDVYVGCVPRVKRGGTRRDIMPARMLWADCDHPSCLQALGELGVAPAMIVSSGTSGHVHAYWPLARSLSASALEEANRRLARALGADRKCANASRILRPAGTLNFKHAPPGRVRLERFEPGVRYDPDELLKILPREDRARPAMVERTARGRHSDPLQQIPPAHYVRLLTGRVPGADGKIHCPFHEDSTPSFHAYSTSAQGWVCYGCPTPDGKPLGGDIYTLASHLWGIPARGPSFHDLRARLDDVFGIRRGHPTTRRPAQNAPDDQRPSPPSRQRQPTSRAMAHLRLLEREPFEIER